MNVTSSLSQSDHPVPSRSQNSEARKKKRRESKDTPSYTAPPLIVQNVNPESDNDCMEESQSSVIARNPMGPPLGPLDMAERVWTRCNSSFYNSISDNVPASSDQIIVAPPGICMSQD